MLTFMEAIGSMEKDETASILIANGFSQAWNVEIFNYANILEAANFGERDDVIRPLFVNLGTYDFETIMKYLVAAEKVLTAYEADEALILQISSDKEVLKEALITAISNTHPNLPTEVTNAQFIAARKFMSQFKEVFSINYDLLFYWARNKYNLDPENYRTDDGFRAELRWEGYGADQEIHFLHGGLHIYDTGSYIKKHACTEEGNSIIDQVRDNLNQGKFPLFISEPTYQKKKQRIEHNPYLNYCFRALRELSGTLFIHGHSMNENDKHIFDQIRSSHISKVFVSVYGDENTDDNSRTMANAQTYLQQHNVDVLFYQAESAPVWA